MLVRPVVHAVFALRSRSRKRHVEHELRVRPLHKTCARGEGIPTKDVVITPLNRTSAPRVPMFSSSLTFTTASRDVNDPFARHLGTISHANGRTVEGIFERLAAHTHIEACLGAVPEKLYHMGIRGKVARTTLADANETRDWRIYADFAQRLIATARQLYVDEDLAIELGRTAYALDSTTVDLCLSLFPWANFRTTKAGVPHLTG